MKVSKRILAAALSLATVSGTMTAVVPVNAAKPISEIVEDSGLDIDYARALQYSMYFYDANMCGTEVDENTRLSWRGDCHTYDAHVPMQSMKDDEGNLRNGTNLSDEFMEKYKDVLDPDGDGTIDVAGGMHDAGDHVEFGMPENYAAATLGWGYYEFRDSYVKLGQDDHIETLLRYFNDYLMKCTFRDKDGKVIAHCYQVGEGGIDHAVWESPEVDSMVRPAFFLTAEKPQTDYVVSACASLAINYMNFKDTDPEYAEKSLDYANALWEFANENEKQLSDNGDGPVQFYSSSKWEDDWCWAAAWMYLCTSDASCFDYAVSIFDYYAPSGWCYCWNDVWSGAAVMWAVINQEHPELNLVQKIRDAQGKNEYVFDDFWDDDCLGKCYRTWKDTETKGGYAYLNEWGSARYNTAMQFILMVIDKHHNYDKPSEYSEWAKKQMNLILGQNDITYTERINANQAAENAGEEKPWSDDQLHGKRSLVVGYNDDSVQYPHHRAASGLLSAEDTREQRHVLWGALAGGFDNNDAHDDYTNNYILNEVTIDYNAAFVGACAGMYHFFGTDDMKITPNFPPEDEGRGTSSEEGGSGYWVEACGIDDLHSDGAGVTKVSFKVMTGVTKPSTKISVRYYFSSKEMSSISSVKIGELYDQSSAEVTGVDGVISGPFKYDKTPDTYYVEISWDGYAIANSGKKYQFWTGMYYGDKWDSTNDWSYQGLPIFEGDDAFFGNGNESKVDNICVYDDGVLVGGTEPDGSTPDVDEPTTGTTGGDILYGDANCDETVDISDAVMILQTLANNDKYGISGTDPSHITAQGMKNADCSSSGDGVTTKDALAVQKYVVGLITLPEE